MAPAMVSSPDKISLPDFLKQLTSGKNSSLKGHACCIEDVCSWFTDCPSSGDRNDSWRIRYKTHHTPAALIRLTDTSLKSLGIEEKDLRRLTLAAIKKANWNSTTTETAGPTGVRAGAHPKVGDIKSVGSATALPSISGPGSSKPKVRVFISSYQDDGISRLSVDIDTLADRSDPDIIQHRHFARADVCPEAETEHRG